MCVILLRFTGRLFAGRLFAYPTFLRRSCHVAILDIVSATATEPLWHLILDTPYPRVHHDGALAILLLLTKASAETASTITIPERFADEGAAKLLADAHAPVELRNNAAQLVTVVQSLYPDTWNGRFANAKEQALKELGTDASAIAEQMRQNLSKIK